MNCLNGFATEKEKRWLKLKQKLRKISDEIEVKYDGH